MYAPLQGSNTTSNSFRALSRRPLSLAGTIEVVGEAATHEGAVASVSQLKPDVVLLALEMVGGAVGGLPNPRKGSTEAFGGTNGARTT